jgi:hypothetical protein
MLQVSTSVKPGILLPWQTRPKTLEPTQELENVDMMRRKEGGGREVVFIRDGIDAK